jgi:hypothetical protein
MKALDFKMVILTSIISMSLLNCAGPLKQQARTVKVAPLSEEYRLPKGIRGKVYVLLAEVSTGQEQYKQVASDSLTQALRECSKDIDVSSFITILDKPDKECMAFDNLEVLSFSDFANKLNEKGISQKYSELRDFYRKNGMFSESDLIVLGNEVGADYFILPCVLDVRRWQASRITALGVRVADTQIICAVVSMEIWDTRTSRKVFGATSDVTVASESIRESPISIEEGFEWAWLGIIKEMVK